MTEVSRRTVLGGAAWSVPAVAIAAAVPAAAVSGQLDPDQFSLESLFGVGFYPYV